MLIRNINIVYHRFMKVDSRYNKIYKHKNILFWLYAFTQRSNVYVSHMRHFFCETQKHD